MKKIQLAYAAVLMAATPVGLSAVIDIPDGDTSEAHRALCLAASTDERVTLRLAYRGHYDFSIVASAAPASEDTAKIHGGFDFCTRDESGVNAPQSVRGRVVVEGRGATVTGFDIPVNGGDLTVRDVNFVGAGNHIVNTSGKLVLERVGIIGGTRSLPANRRRVPMIENRGELVMKNVTVADVLYGGECDPGAVALENHGTARINNASFYRNRIASLQCAEVAADIWTASDARTVVSNSIIGSVGSVYPACIGPLNSRGNNFAVEGHCPQLDAESDGFISGQSIPWRLRLLDHRYALTPVPESPTVNSRQSPETARECETTDQRGFLRDEAITGACDAGAIELDALPTIAPAQVSGYWYDPGRDGIYVHVNLLSSNLAYVLFQTFDSDGAPAWYYGTGRPQGERVEVTLYRNDGLAVRGGVVSGSVAAIEVGKATFTVGSCFNASFEYRVTHRGIGSGSLELDRLTFTEGLECIDRR